MKAIQERPGLWARARYCEPMAAHAGRNFSPQYHARCEELSGKAAEGSPSEDETAELDELLAASAVLAALQSKARLSLREQTPAA